MSIIILPLPQEVLLSILSYCDYATALALSLTCKDLCGFRPCEYEMIDLLQIERWPCYNLAGQAEDHMKQPLVGRDYFSCYLCLRIRSVVKFSNAMMKGKRRKHSRATGDELQPRLNRFCIDCGIRYGRYQAGTVFDFGGARVGYLYQELAGGQGLVCRKCRSFSRLSNDEARMTKLCGSCSRRN